MSENGDARHNPLLQGSTLLRVVREVTAATTEQLPLDELTHRCCRELKESWPSHPCAMVGIHLIDPLERTIRAISRIGPGWAPLSKHPLDSPPELRDIQADIATANPPRMEIVHGDDPRFHRWIYQRFGHQTYTRLWIPLVLLEDERGLPLEKWWSRYLWVCRRRNDSSGSTAMFELDLSPSTGQARPGIKIIGTVEAGYPYPCVISDEQALTLAALASRCAAEIHRATLPHVLATIARCAQESLNATYATIHLAPNSDRTAYAYESSSGLLVRDVPLHRPRPNGTGKRALESGNPESLREAIASDTDLQHMASLGIVAAVAAPLVVDDVKGVLYVGYDTEPPPAVEVFLKLFADHARDAIRQTIVYGRILDNARSMETLNEVARALVSDASGETLLEQIAGCAGVVLAADVVRIYEYFSDDKWLRNPPTTVGRLLQAQHEQRPLTENLSPPLWVATQCDPIFESDTKRNDNLSLPRFRDGEVLNFVTREDIKSTAAVQLVASNEVVGIMFVNYRRRHAFGPDERRIITAFASTAAIAIRNRRIYKQREDDLTVFGHQMRSNIGSARAWLDEDDLALLPGAAANARAVLADGLNLFEGLRFALSTPTEHPIPVTVDQLDVVDELTNLSTRLQSIYKRRDLRFEFPDRHDKFHGDRRLFNNVIYSLVENAVKYSDSNTPIIFHYELGDQMQILSIQNTAEPISPRDKERIFQKFQRGSEHRRSSVGAGLGLWVARRVMQAVGGSIEVDLSEHLPRRAIFIVKWPLPQAADSPSSAADTGVS